MDPGDGDLALALVLSGLLCWPLGLGLVLLALGAGWSAGLRVRDRRAGVASRAVTVWALRVGCGGFLLVVWLQTGLL